MFYLKSFHSPKDGVAFMDKGMPGMAARCAEGGMRMAEYRQMSIYFDLEKPEEAWAYQYLMSLRHGKKALIITALRMLLGKGEQMVSFPAPVMQSPGSGGKKKSAGRRMPGRAAAKSGAGVGDADSGIVEKQDGIPAGGGSSGRNPAESALPETMPPDGDIPAQGSGETEPGWHAFFTQEQLAAIQEKGLDLSLLTEDGIRQMAGQVQDGIPARAAYKEALMWCR